MRHLQKFALGSILVVVGYVFVGSINVEEYTRHHRSAQSVSGQQEFLTTATIKR